jgi:hypothetical protein
MTRAHSILSLLLAALLGLLAVVSGCSRFKKIEQRGAAAESVAAILPGDRDAAVAAVFATFNDWAEFSAANRGGSYPNKFPLGSKWRDFFLFRKNDPRHPMFPPDEELLLDRGVDSFVERYVRIPAELRKSDLYLYEVSGDYFWESPEYFYNGQPAKFRCSFLIHFEPAGDSGTKVEVFEYQPMIWVGEYFGFSAHSILPTTLHDIRPAQPTTADRKEVLLMIEDAATLTPLRATLSNPANAHPRAARFGPATTIPAPAKAAGAGRPTASPSGTQVHTR